ncbi:MAG: signal peptide peptidase SppA [Candidatus Woesearchaeota archaeon]
MKKSRWGTIAIVLIILFITASIISGILSLFTSGMPDQSGNVLVIPVTGSIVSSRAETLFGESLTSSTAIISLLDDVSEDPTIEAVIFEINSAGGGAVASEEIMSKIKTLEIPTVAVIRDVGASGAYWIASATDHIISNPLSSVGSIGVILSYLEFGDFLKDNNVTYQRLVSGKYKDMGTPFRELTDEEIEMVQQRLDFVKTYFMESVAENRGMDVEDIEPLSEGQIFLGSESVDLGLVDDLGNIDDAKLYLESVLDKNVSLRRHVEQRSIFDVFALKSDRKFFMMGKGIGETMFSGDDASFVINT